MTDRQLLDEESILWMFDAFGWALRNFDSKVFYKETVLVNPSKEHFPGQHESPEGMAKLIFEQVKEFAGLSHWPFQLVSDEVVESIESPRLLINGIMRGSQGVTSNTDEKLNKLIVPYNPGLLRDPQVLIATYAHNLAHYLGLLAQEPPPGGQENWPHITELLAVFSGFGIFMANSAFTQKIRSCSSCSGPAVERTNFLSQYDISYALAIFCALKGISKADANRYLKTSLRPFYKKAVQDVTERSDELNKLKAIDMPLLAGTFEYIPSHA